jgi:hypothetical protein
MPGEKIAALRIGIDARSSLEGPTPNLPSAVRNRGYSSVLLAIALLATPISEEIPAQNGKPPAAASAPALSAEEKEILKYRDLLENLELLQNLEKIKYLDFFTEKKEGKGKEKSGAKPQVKENARKDSNATPNPK